MKRAVVGWGILMSLAFVAPAFAAAKPAAAKPAPAARGARFQTVSLGILNRIFHDFRDEQKVKLGQDFLLGDTDYSARVVQYLPDFQMDLKTHRFFSLSDQPRNPAFKIIVRKGKVPQDTTWAFLKSPPHFAAKSFFAFLVLRIDFADRPALVADTTRAATPPGVPHPPVAPATQDSTKGR